MRCGLSSHNKERRPGAEQHATEQHLAAASCRHGPGTMMYGNGDVFEGIWAFDKKHGPGTHFYMSRGKRFDGVWSEGVPKAGSYSEVHAPPPGTAGSLPPCELRAPDAVLANAAAEVMAQL